MDSDENSNQPAAHPHPEGGELRVYFCRLGMLNCVILNYTTSNYFLFSSSFLFQIMQHLRPR